MSSEDSSTDSAMYFVPIGPTSDRSSIVARPAREEYERFYIAYGECFSAWSGVEFGLLAIYMGLLNSSEYHAASAAFYSTAGFRAKLDMVDAIVNNSTRVVPEDLKIWTKLFENASTRSRRRNDLAHNAVFFGRLSDAGERKMFVADPRTPAEGSRLHVHDLLEIRESFVALREELLSFWNRLRSHAG